MLKPTASYRMTKQSKRLLATSSMINSHVRGEHKRAIIQAELAALIQPKREKRKEPAGE
jgi:hypothetical protein